MNNTTVDESQYSRQLHTIGAEAQKALESVSVLISGMSGLGLEIAKCVIMTGVKSVTLHDTKLITQMDLSSNYYAQMEDIGKLRTDVVKSQLASLNPKVNVNVSNDLHLTKTHAKRFQVVVICDSPLDEQINLNEIFRQYGTKYIYANTTGLFGNIFCDFGDEFTTYDSNGETPISGILTQICDGNLISSEPHGLYVGDTINFKIGNNEFTDEVSKIINLTSFQIKENEINDQLLSNSSFVQKKKPVTINFKSLKESISLPNSVEFSMVMSEDFDRQRLLHDWFIELNKFVKSSGRYPNHWSNLDSEQIISKIQYNDETQLNVLKKLCYTSYTKLVEIDSIIASIVAQEVIKGASKKYTPIKQWLYFDTTSTLPEENLIFSEEKYVEEYENLPNDRYLGRYLVYGKTFQRKIMESNIFVVGAGAIGCEHLKNIAMIGVGKVVITDMDTIEKSNLNRQFLFRNSDIGKSKSESAKNAINIMNPYVDIVAQQNKVCADTLSVYDENFFSQQSMVLTALDNVDARLFVDYLCLQNKVPLIDAGTLGTKCNVQVVIPHLTETYGQSRDPPEKEIPMCTLKNFPYLIEHCIQWARDMFEGMFVRAPQDFMQYKQNPEKYKQLGEGDRNLLTEVVTNVNFVKDNMACHIKECLQFAYKLWHENFRDHIYHLTQKYPENCVTSENLPFWTGTKKFPKFDDFKGTDIEMIFLESVANLWAEVCGLKLKVTKKQLVSFVKKSTPPKIKNQNNIIAENEKQQKEIEIATGKSINDLINMLPNVEEINDINVNSLEFEKDDDTNFHIDFVTSASNCRAINYGIQTADKFKTKGIAGKIIPAIVTTTSLVSGFAMIELIKVFQNFNKIEKYSNVFANLALPVIAISDPIEIKKTKVGNLEYSVWDTIVFDDMKVTELIKKVIETIQDETMTVTAISSGPFQLYSVNHSNKLIFERQNMKVSDIYKKITNDSMLKYIQLIIELEKKYKSNESYESDESDDSDDDCQYLECKVKVHH